MSERARLNDAIDLVSGLADVELDADLHQFFDFYLRKGNINYAPTRGVMELRKILSELSSQRFGAEFDVEKEIAITAGATQGLSTAITAFVKENDEVIVFEPSYDIYTPLIKMNGGIPVYVELTRPEYKIDWDELNRAITSRTKLMIFNNPHNPTGTVFDRQDLMKLQKALAGTKILLIADEVFEHYVYDDLMHESVAKYPELSNRSIIVSSLGKTFSANGFRLGYCLAQEEIMKEFIKFHQYMIDSVNAPLQYAVADFLKQTGKLSHIKDVYQAKRDYFLGLLADTKFSFSPAQGTYFQLLKYDQLSDERDTDFANRLIDKIGVAGVPLSAFYHGRYDTKCIRFSFMRKNETLQKAAEHLYKLQQTL